MPRNEFGRELTVSAAPARAWATLIDVPVLVSWISVLEQAEELTHLERYTAVLLDRLGPFKLRDDLAITLSDQYMAFLEELDRKNVGREGTTP